MMDLRYSKLALLNKSVEQDCDARPLVRGQGEVFMVEDAIVEPR